MHSSDGRYVVVFNGEIYNFAELRELLVREGAAFQTRSDTEVILEGYRCWGKDVVHRLEGMFAFLALGPSRKNRVCGPRSFGDQAALLGGELRPPRCSLHSRADTGAWMNFDRIDLIAVRDLMTFDYIPAPRSCCEGCRSSTQAVGFNGSGEKRGPPSVERYWRPPEVNANSQPPDEFELEQLLEAAVRRQMISDVPIGAFLSGGIDSSLLVALMSRHSARPVRTFSVSFAEGVLTSRRLQTKSQGTLRRTIRSCAQRL